MAVLHDRDLVVVGAGIRGGVGNGDGDVLPEVVRRIGPEAGKGVDELLQSWREVAAAGRGDRDSGDGALGRDRRRGAGELVERGDTVGDRDGRRGVIALTAGGDVDLTDLDPSPQRRRRRPDW